MGMEAKQPGGDPNRFDWFDALDEFNQRSDARPQVKRAFERIWRWAEGRENYVYGFTVKNLSTWLKCDDRTGREVFEELLQRYERKGVEREGLWLVEIITNQAGVMKLYVYDPREELRQIKPEPDDRQGRLFDDPEGTPSGILVQESPTPTGAPLLRVVTSRESDQPDEDSSGIPAQESPTPTDLEPGGSPVAERPSSDGCAVADGHLLPALKAAIGAKLGAIRFDTWFRRNLFSVQGDTLTCTCPDPVNRATVHGLRSEIIEACNHLLPGIKFFTVVDRELVTASQGSGISAQESPTAQEEASPLEPLQGSKEEASPLEPLQGSKGEASKKDLRPKPPERVLRETALGKRAAEIHAQIDDPICYRWFPLQAAFAEQQGWLSAHRVEAMASEPYFCRSLQKALGPRYLPMHSFKKKLASIGIKWKKFFEKGSGPDDFWREHDDKSNVKPKPR